MDLRTVYVPPDVAPALARALADAGYAVTPEDCCGHLKRLIDTLEPRDAQARRILYYLADGILFGGYDNADETLV
jgi:hypothetical protein